MKSGIFISKKKLVFFLCFFFVNVVLLFWDSDFLSFVLLTESVWLLFSSHLCLLNILKDHNAIEMVV